VSTSVQVWTESTPTIEHGALVIDETVRLLLPINATDAAEWCESFAALLADHARASRARAAEDQRLLAALQRDVEELQRARLAADPDG
jgi:hypothetical protein